MVSRGWHGYLVRALNEFASLTAQCGTQEISQPMAAQIKTPIRVRSVRSQKKSCNSVRRRRSR